MMKFIHLWLIALFAAFFAACAPDGKSSGGDNSQPASSSINARSPAATAVVQHFICPNNCEGSGGPEAGTCPVCGTNYIHNAAFHANDPNNDGTQNLSGPQNPQFQQNTTTPQNIEPAQNAAGEYHYICSNGCAGGSGTGGVCAKCGGPLTHNQKYHQ